MEHYSDNETKPIQTKTLLWVSFVGCVLAAAYLGDHDRTPYAVAFSVFGFVSLIAAFVVTIAEYEKT